MRAERDDSEATRLRTTKRLLVLRRQWEILAEELPGVLAASLRPVGAAAGAGSDAERRTGPPAAPAPTFAAAMEAYAASPRSFGDVWGRPWSTALGVRSAAALWSATRPAKRAWRWLRIPVQPLPMCVVGTVLARFDGLLALALAFNVVLVSRLRGLVAWLVLALGAGGAVLLARLYRRRDWQPPPHATAAIVGTILTFVAGAVLAQVPAARRWFFDLPADAALTHFDRHLLNPYTWAATAAAIVATWLLWSWARLGWRLLVARRGRGDHRLLGGVLADEADGRRRRVVAPGLRVPADPVGPGAVRDRDDGDRPPGVRTALVDRRVRPRLSRPAQIVAVGGSSGSSASARLFMQ